MPGKPYPDDVKAEAVRLYVDEERMLEEVAEEIGCTPKTVWRWVRAAGHERTKADAWDILRRERVRWAVRLRSRRYTRREIADMMDLSTRQVSRLLAFARAAGGAR